MLVVLVVVVPMAVFRRGGSGDGGVGAGGGADVGVGCVGWSAVESMEAVVVSVGGVRLLAWQCSLEIALAFTTAWPECA